MSERVTVRLTKTGGASGVCLFGDLKKGTVIDVRVSISVGPELEQKVRARRMLEREHPKENQMEWDAEVVG